MNQQDSFVFAFIRETSKNWKSPLLIGLIVQIISNLQLTFLVLQPLPVQSPDKNFFCIVILQRLSSRVTMLARSEFFQSDFMVQAFWFVCLAYFKFHIAMVLKIFIQYIRNKQPRSRFPLFTTKLYLLHSRMIFFPIHHFLIWYIEVYGGSLSRISNGLITNKAIGILVSVALDWFNISIALFTELCCYQIRKSKNAFASKNNFYPKLALVHKIVQIILFFFVKSSIKDSILIVSNIATSLLYCWDLIVRLSFYNILMLKVHVCFAVSHLVLSILILINLIGVWKNYSEIILIVTVPLVIKIYFKFLGQTLTRLVTFDFRTPEEAAHVPTLLKIYMNCNPNVFMSTANSEGAQVFKYGLLNFYTDEIQKIKRENDNLGDVQQVYMTFLKRCNALLRRNPKSELLLIIMAQIYVNRIGNIANCLSLIDRLEDSRVTFAAQNSARMIIKKLERIYSKASADSDEKLEVLKFFDKRDFGIKLQESIQMEIFEHLKFWREVSQEKVDAKLVIDIANRIDDIARKIKKSWLAFFKDSNMVFSTAVLLYGIYLEVVRSDNYEKTCLLQKYNNLIKNKDSSKKINPFNDRVVILLVSIELDKIGRVVDASSSVKPMFKVERDRLIGNKLYGLMPKIVAKDHDAYISRFNRLENRGISRELTTYAKTVDGDFFQIELEVRLCPSLAKGLNLMAQIKQVKGSELIIIADKNGVIVDCSTDLFQTFKINIKDIDSIKVTDLCPDFEAIHHSFNICYYGDKEVTLVPPEIVQEKDMNDFGINTINIKALKSQPVKMLSLRSNEEKLLDEDLRKTETPSSTKKQSQSNVSARYIYKINAPTLNEGGGGGDEERRAVPSIQMPTYINKEIAHDLCQRFKDGVKLNFYPLNREKTVVKKIDRTEFVVRVEPYTVNGKYFKMIKLKNFLIEQKIVNYLKVDTLANVLNNQDTTPTNRGANASPKAKKNNKDKKSRVEENFEAMRKVSMMINKGEIAGRLSAGGAATSPKAGSADKDKNIEELGLLKHDSIRQNARRTFTLMKTQLQPQSSFSKGSNQSGVQTQKTLSQLYQKQSLRPATKFSIFIVYFTMLVVFLLTIVDYFFSKQSIRDIQTGVDIVDSANTRLVDTIVAWQWTLIIYTRTVQIRAIVPSFIESARTIINDRNSKMIKVNNNLKAKLEKIMNQEFENTFFAKNIPFWQPSSGNLFAFDYIDSFLATKVLSTKYSEIARFNKSVLLLKDNEDLLFAVNNTANGNLISSEEQIRQANVILENIITSNKRLLIGLLILKITSLLLVLISLILLVRVVFLSYMRLFRALVKVKMIDIIYRVAELELVSTCLKQDIESTKFADQLENYQDTAHYQTRRLVRKGKKTRPRFQDDKVIVTSLIIQTVKYLAIALGLLAILTIVFSVSFYNSTSRFDTLGLIISRISLAYRLGYQFDMLLPIFYFFIVFEGNPNYMIRNQSPELQFNNSLEVLTKANHMLLESLSDPDTGFGDPILEDFFEHNLCNYVSDSVISNCERSSKGKILGFTELNAQYVDTHITWASEYRRNRTYSNAFVILVSYAAQITDDITIMEDAYRFLANHLLQNFADAAENTNSESLSMFVIILLTIFFSTLIIQFIAIKKFKNNDLATKKILKLIPLKIVKDTKILGAFLVGEYKKELQSIRRFLQNN